MKLCQIKLQTTFKISFTLLGQAKAIHNVTSSNKAIHNVTSSNFIEHYEI